MADKINELVEKIKHLSETEYYQLKIEEENPEITDSKIGGLPYWIEGKDFPTDEEGNKLYLLAQINFEKEKTSAPLPEKGLLQFFIADNDIMGVDYDDQITQKNFRIVYHENIDAAITKEFVEELGIKSSEEAENHPVKGEHKISLTKNKDYATVNDYRFSKIFVQAYKEIYGKEIKSEEKYYNILNDKDTEILEKGLLMNPNSACHKMLGYAFFTQEDPRYDKKYEDYDTLLLQLDSDGYDGDIIIWGDVGVANFFMKKKALEEKDFSDVIYNWDCS